MIIRAALRLFRRADYFPSRTITGFAPRGRYSETQIARSFRWLREKDLTEREGNLIWPNIVNHEIKEMRSRLLKLVNGGTHNSEIEESSEGDVFTGRARIIGNYYKAYLQALEKFETSDSKQLVAKAYDEKMEIFHLPVSDEKASGSLIVAIKDGELVGRMFVADIDAETKHLTVLTSSHEMFLWGAGLDKKDQPIIAQEMLKAYFAVKKIPDLEKVRFRISCMGDYQDLLTQLGRKTFGDDLPRDAFNS